MYFPLFLPFRATYKEIFSHIATRNMFYDEKKKHLHIKKEILDDVMEINQRLYELENILSDKDLVRISKSQIVNINKIQSLKPELNRTILATMCNNEQLSISRKYVKTIRSILSI